MAQVLKHIDKIAREKQRDVLFVCFEGDKFKDKEYEDYVERNDFIVFLEKNNIGYEKCGEIASENGWKRYQGQLYIDVPYEKENTQYQILEKYLENEDGTSKIEGVIFYYLTLEIAMKNAHHDEPGFWDRWAENF